MKIEKHGNKNIEVESGSHFVCANCGCEFFANEDEIYKHNTDGLTSISATTTDYYVCSCPECHKICKLTHVRQKYNFCDGSETTIYTSCNTNIEPKVSVR